MNFKILLISMILMTFITTFIECRPPRDYGEAVKQIERKHRKTGKVNPLDYDKYDQGKSGINDI